MSGVTGDGSEDLPNYSKPIQEMNLCPEIYEIPRYDCEMTSDFYENSYASMVQHQHGEYVRYEDHIAKLENAAAKPQPSDYLLQKIRNAHGELKILTDNIQLLKPHHIRQLIELNAMVGNILIWQALDAEEQEEEKCKS